MFKKYAVVAVVVLGTLLFMMLPGCAVCKSSDTIEQCRTKKRDHSQPTMEFARGIT